MCLFNTTQSIMFQSLAPSEAPGMVEINSNTPYNELDVTWKHVAAQHFNRELIGYKLRLLLLEIGGQLILARKIEEKLIHPSQNRITVSRLKPNAKYSVTLLASNEFEDGASSSPVIQGKLFFIQTPAPSTHLFSLFRCSSFCNSFFLILLSCEN